MSKKGTGPIYLEVLLLYQRCCSFVNRKGTRIGNSGVALFNVEVSKKLVVFINQFDVFILAITKSLLKGIARTDEGYFYRRSPYTDMSHNTSHRYRYCIRN